MQMDVVTVVAEAVVTERIDLLPAGSLKPIVVADHGSVTVSQSSTSAKRKRKGGSSHFMIDLLKNTFSTSKKLGTACQLASTLTIELRRKNGKEEQIQEPKVFRRSTKRTKDDSWYSYELGHQGLVFCHVESK